MQDQSEQGKVTERSRLVDPTKAAFAATVFAASVVLTGCSGAQSSNNPYCPPSPTPQQLKAMSDAKARECLEAADREGRSSSYNSYYNHYTGRGFSYTRIPSGTSTSGPSHFVAPSGGGYSSGSTYKSGGGGSFSGSKSSGGATS